MSKTGDRLLRRATATTPTPSGAKRLGTEPSLPDEVERLCRHREREAFRKAHAIVAEWHGCPAEVLNQLKRLIGDQN